ncbi:MAG: hypothetical protein Sv326_0441 [Candidatus Fermentimicrarchaeum limneticum]|uniref:Uncharacterized protein n=1 Tax=Fermentimicrarchaeum limneticum TaxID=2795018 RepID=A0A7D6BL98_FERL1|nr:MAG: hypothetical protein Sv326_0367 [Candidatus Fermentimicrarchaeum limneticum]QLJ52579.1 MAG: hypothetical protein Sv326_0404 [Candidatus Fermentimicrarchaeum limneticum]QLJ52616.1 MAG: hypothetical protein Sv326_0441 [Candidatus Fermentimicrarchaeum limneticum]
MTYPNLTNVTSIEGLASYDNAVTGGYYAPMVVFSIFIIVLGITAAYLKNKSIVVASFFSTMSAIFLWLLGLLAWTYLAVCVVVLIASSILLIRESG